MEVEEKEARGESKNTMNVSMRDPGPSRLRSGLPIAWLFLAVPCLGGCVLQDQHLRELAERDDQIRSLQEERTALKAQMRDLEYQRDSLETSLIDANSRASTAAAPAGAAQETPQSFAELDSVGVGYGKNAAGEPMLTIPAEITFASGKAELSSKGRSALDAVARTLKREFPDANYWIEGHTDSDPIKHSSFGTNRDLSLARAMAVLHYFVESGGIPDEHCIVVGHGQYQPLVAETGPAGKAKNRRVEIVVRRP
jgi:flagellar motor protein MotB